MTTSASTSPARHPQRRLRIAVADDESEMRQFLQKAGSHLGHDVVVVAENGHDLVVGCTRTRPDLIVTDLIMPELDGLSALDAIRRQFPIRAIVITAHDWPELRSRAQQMGVLAYLVKPVGLNELRPLIDAAARGDESHGGTPSHPTSELARRKTRRES